MLSSLALITYLWIWIALAMVYLIQNPPSKLSKSCPGSGVWPALLLAMVWTLIGTLGGLRLVLDAQSGVRPPGAHWPRNKKIQILGTAGATFLSLWVSAGATSLSTCARTGLANNDVRQALLIWFCVNTGAICFGIAAWVIKRALGARMRRLETKACNVRDINFDIGAGGGAGARVVI